MFYIQFFHKMSPVHTSSSFDQVSLYRIGGRIIRPLRVSASDCSLGIVSGGFGGVADSTTGTVCISAFCSCGTVSTGLGVLSSVITVSLFYTEVSS